MTGDVLTLTLPMPPNLGNSRTHWRTKHRQRTDYFALLDGLLLVRQLPYPPKRPWDCATIRADMVLGSAMDDDNAVSRAKWSVDWMVRRGYLTDDRRKVLRWESFPTQRVSRKERPSLTLTLTRVGAHKAA